MSSSRKVVSDWDWILLLHLIIMSWHVCIKTKNKSKTSYSYKQEAISFIFEFQGMESESVKIFTYEDLKQFTDDFSEENFIGRFQRGKIYRGYYGEKAVTVKKWKLPYRLYSYHKGENEGRLKVFILSTLIIALLFFYCNWKSWYYLLSYRMKLCYYSIHKCYLTLTWSN